MGNFLFFKYYSKLFIQWTTDQELEDRFGEFGKIKGIRFLEEKVSGKSKGVAFIEFSSSQSAALAKEKLQGRLVFYFQPIFLLAK